MKKTFSIFTVLGILAVMMTALHMVYYNFSIFAGIPYLADFVQIFFNMTIFKNILLCKIVILLLTSLAAAGAHNYRDFKISRVSVLAIIAGLSFLFSHIIAPGYLYIILSVVAYVGYIFCAAIICAYLFADNNEKNTLACSNFMQTRDCISNEDSVNIPTKFMYNDKVYKGYINIVNPYRGNMVLGVPGSGKSFSIYYHYMEQMISKGYTMYLYDYKYPDLSKIAYNILKYNADKYDYPVGFYVINFDDPRKTHRANPLNPIFMTDIIDAYEAAYMVLVNLNRTWTSKQGDFFVESAIVYFTAIIWYLKLHKNGLYCTLPHAIELLMQPYEAVFNMLQKEEEIKNYLAPFINAMDGNAMEQLQGQLASAQIPLTRLSSPTIYWAMSGDDFTLDINNPREPKIVCIANNPDRQSIYAAALSLYNSRIFKIINKPGKLKSAIMLDELPTMFNKGLDNLIATARSNKVAVVAGAQDLSQIIRDYGDKEAKVIIGTIGNILSGQVKAETAKMLSEMFGKIHVERKSVTIHERDNNISKSTQLEDLIPASVISSLSQGEFVGSVADNNNQKIKQKFFYAEVIPNENVLSHIKNYVDIPYLADFEDDAMEEIVKDNYKKIKQEIEDMITPYS